MEKKFENVGVVYMASTKRSLKIEYNSDESVFTREGYVSIKDLEDVIKGHKKTATIWKPKPKERPLSCDVHTE